jgi:inhibitor of KinA
MRIEPLGDSAYILRDLPAPAHVIAKQLNENPPTGLVEAVASYDTVGIYGNPDTDAVLCADYTSDLREGKLHLIPVCYEMGEDLELVGNALNLGADELIAAHSQPAYTCFAIGFCPGFAYLGYLAQGIDGMGRMPSPRTRVDPGSVAITGRQTAVYPLPRPGGWWLIGRTPLTLVDVADDYFPIEAGDRVQFHPIGPDEFRGLRGERL